jgi:hypothetical protein
VCCVGLGLFLVLVLEVAAGWFGGKGTRLVGFGSKTVTLLVRGGGGGERSSWSSLVSELFMLGVSSFSFSREPPWSVKTSL